MRTITLEPSMPLATPDVKLSPDDAARAEGFGFIGTKKQRLLLRGALSLASAFCASPELQAAVPQVLDSGSPMGRLVASSMALLFDGTVDNGADVAYAVDEASFDELLREVARTCAALHNVLSISGVRESHAEQQQRAAS